VRDTRIVFESLRTDMNGLVTCCDPLEGAVRRFQRVQSKLAIYHARPSLSWSHPDGVCGRRYSQLRFRNAVGSKALVKSRRDQVRVWGWSAAHPPARQMACLLRR
jgi:hypothetical protein